MDLIIDAPLNQLSFGNVSFNFLRELYRADIKIAYFPNGEIDASSFKQDEGFSLWLKEAFDKRYEALGKNLKTLKLWHLAKSDYLRSREQYLLTFYECNSPTKHEKNINALQNKTLFSSKAAAELFENSDTFQVGFDEDFKITNKKYLDGVIHFGLFGKFEKRKHTEKIIKTWLKKYGNDNRYLLSCCVTNPFFKEEDMNKILAQLLEDKQYSNINFLPWLKTNEEMNEMHNSIDIDLTGMSGGEGWNIPAFNSTCLGKWALVLAHTGHLEWANEDNSILIKPNGEQESDDGIFFRKGADYNQGTFSTFSEEDLIKGMELAETKVGQFNSCGALVGQTFTYKRSLESILAKI